MTIQDIKDFINDANHSHALISTSLNWADECDFIGFYIYNKESAKKLLEVIEKIGDFTFDIGFGTNEFNDEEHIDTIMNQSEIDLLTQPEAIVLLRIFPDGEFGHHINNHLGQFYEFNENDWKEFRCEDDDDDHEEEDD